MIISEVTRHAVSPPWACGNEDEDTRSGSEECWESIKVAEGVLPVACVTEVKLHNSSESYGEVHPTYNKNSVISQTCRSDVSETFTRNLNYHETGKRVFKEFDRRHDILVQKNDHIDDTNGISTHDVSFHSRPTEHWRIERQKCRMEINPALKQTMFKYDSVAPEPYDVSNDTIVQVQNIPHFDLSLQKERHELPIKQDVEQTVNHLSGNQDVCSHRSKSVESFFPRQQNEQLDMSPSRSASANSTIQIASRHHINNAPCKTPSFPVSHGSQGVEFREGDFRFEEKSSSLHDRRDLCSSISPNNLLSQPRVPEVWSGGDSDGHSPDFVHTSGHVADAAVTECVVCGEMANGHFFGAIVCLPCKVRYFQYCFKGAMFRYVF